MKIYWLYEIFDVVNMTNLKIVIQMLNYEGKASFPLKQQKDTKIYVYILIRDTNDGEIPWWKIFTIL